jgi:tetratricopeptide (TPR) repeat protein
VAPVVIQQPIILGTGASYVPSVFDYAQPLDTNIAPPPSSDRDIADQRFDAARAAFKSGDYTQALQLTDEALAKLPNDATLHEFRALVFFALKRYDAAAEALYAVLAVGPGWDWATLIGLYPGVDTYTQQLRSLETYRDENFDSSSAHFVLAYHYVTQGHKDAAIGELEQVSRLIPDDKLAGAMLKSLRAENANPNAAAEPPAPGPDAAAAPVRPPLAIEKLTGRWIATAAGGTTIRLTIDANSKFVWSVTARGRTDEFSGKFSTDQGVLTLIRDQDKSTLIGSITFLEPGFRFKLEGGGDDDPGLEFRPSK